MDHERVVKRRRLHYANGITFGTGISTDRALQGPSGQVQGHHFQASQSWETTFAFETEQSRGTSAHFAEHSLTENEEWLRNNYANKPQDVSGRQPPDGINHVSSGWQEAAYRDTRCSLQVINHSGAPISHGAGDEGGCAGSSSEVCFGMVHEPSAE
jgi:hypothetical protein